MHKLGVQAPPKALVERYMIEIAKTYNVPFDPDPSVMQEVSFTLTKFEKSILAVCIYACMLVYLPVFLSVCLSVCLNFFFFV